MSAASETTGETVRRLIRKYYPEAPEPLTAELRFEGDLAGDSLSFVELVTRIERDLQLTLTDKEVAAVQTVGALVALVEKTVSRGGSGGGA